MGTVVDPYTARTIEQFILSVQDKQGTRSTTTYKYGYGTLNIAAREVRQWADEAGYKFYKHNNMSAGHLATRLAHFLKGHRVVSQSYEDARWIAAKINEKTKIAVEPSPPVERVITNNVDELLAFSRKMKQQAFNGDPELAAIAAEAELKTLRLLVDRLEG